MFHPPCPRIPRLVDHRNHLPFGFFIQASDGAGFSTLAQSYPILRYISRTCFDSTDLDHVAKYIDLELSKELPAYCS